MSEDPGLQPQRTTLAWTRTGIGAAALTGILIRNATTSGAVIDIVAATFAGAAALSILVFARLRRDQIHAAVAAGASPLARAAIPAVTVLVSGTAICESISVVVKG